MKRLFVTENKYTSTVKIIYPQGLRFQTFAGKYANCIVKKSVHANCLREAK